MLSNRKLLAQLLAKKGLQVQLCEDGVAAVETVKTLPLDTFHVIFMDNTMPKMVCLVIFMLVVVIS